MRGQKWKETILCWFCWLIVQFYQWVMERKLGAWRSKVCARERERLRQTLRERKRKWPRTWGEGWALWQAIKRSKSKDEDERGRKIWEIQSLPPLICFVLLSHSLLWLFFCLSSAPSLPLSQHTIKTAWLCCRLELQNKSHLAKESVEIEPAERKEKIPTESQKEENERDGEGEWKHIAFWTETLLTAGNLQEEIVRRRDRGEEKAANRRKSLWLFSLGPEWVESGPLGQHWWGRCMMNDAIKRWGRWGGRNEKGRWSKEESRIRSGTRWGGERVWV